MSGDAFQKLVHLDLKGAPPRIEFLQQLLPFLKQIGTTGLLVGEEYCSRWLEENGRFTAGTVVSDTRGTTASGVARCYILSRFLAEYEDTFPFKGELSPLSSPHAYTETDISTFLALAKDCSLTVIPLVRSSVFSTVPDR